MSQDTYALTRKVIGVAGDAVIVWMQQTYNESPGAWGITPEAIDRAREVLVSLQAMPDSSLNVFLTAGAAQSVESSQGPNDRDTLDV